MQSWLNPEGELNDIWTWLGPEIRNSLLFMIEASHVSGIDLWLDDPPFEFDSGIAKRFYQWSQHVVAVPPLGMGATFRRYRSRISITKKHSEIPMRVTRFLDCWYWTRVQRKMAHVPEHTPGSKGTHSNSCSIGVWDLKRGCEVEECPYGDQENLGDITILRGEGCTRSNPTRCKTYTYGAMTKFQ